MLDLNVDEFITVQDILSEIDIERVRNELNKMGVSDEYINKAIELINREMNS